MNKIFVDTNYFVALTNASDQLHAQAVQAEHDFIDHSLVTTEDVLIELLNFYCEHGQHVRMRVAEFVRAILLDVRVDVVAHADTTFLEGLELYESRLDKGYSLTDCVSMNVCREMEIKDILTKDKHFAQEGFKILL